MQKRKEMYFQDQEEMEVWAKKFAFDLSPNTLVLLEGDLGAGKTFLVSKIAKALDLGEGRSPSFSLHNIYENNTKRIDHFDLYRLETQYDLEASGFFDVLSDEENLVFIEWADRLDPSFLPLDRKIIKISIHKKKEGRTLFIEEI